MPPPLTGGTNNQRSYSGPTTGSAFDSRTIPGSQGGGNLAVMSMQFSQDMQQAGWDQQVTVPNIAVGIATGALPGWNANGIEALPGPLLNPSNSWMTEFTPEAEQALGYLLQTLAGPDATSLAADLATTDPSDSRLDQGNIFLGPYSDVGNLNQDKNAYYGAGYDMDFYNAVWGPGGILGPPAPPMPTLPGFTFLTSFEIGDWTGAEFSYTGYYDNTTMDVYEIHWGGDTYETVVYGSSGSQTYYSDTIFVLGVGVLYHSGNP